MKAKLIKMALFLMASAILATLIGTLPPLARTIIDIACLTIVFMSAIIVIIYILIDPYDNQSRSGPFK